MGSRRGLDRRLLLWALVLLAVACGGPATENPTPAHHRTGDLADLKRYGQLRILMPPEEVATLPRRGYTLNFERELAEQLAREIGLRPTVITVVDRGQMLDDLEAGRGDLIVARLTATEARRRRFAFSTPIDHVRELLVCRSDDTSISTVEDLAGKRVAARESSSYAETLRELRTRVPRLEIVVVPESADTEELLYQIMLGRYDATVADEDIFAEVGSYLAGLRSPFALTGERPIAWAMRRDSPRLKEAVDRFLYRQAIARRLEGPLAGDLDRIRERRVLRVLTVNTAASYFLYRGAQMGFEFEFARRFASGLGCRIQVIVPPRADQLVPWLIEGRGDLVAASMTIIPERRRRVAFTRPYNFVSEIVVSRATDTIPETFEDLVGRTFAVRPSSSYFATLSKLRNHGFRIVEAPEDLTTENLIGMVAGGAHDLTVADSNILDIELTYRDDVVGAFALGEPQPIAWMVRQENTQLLAAANAFIEREYRGTFYNVLKNKYFRNKRRIARMATGRPARQGSISPYDALFVEQARRIGVDWRLLVAQAYQESRFDPTARSWAGALGLMQVLPATARGLGIDGDLTDPAISVRAGAEYLGWLIETFSDVPDPAERLRFALAAYNAGRGHIQDGRRLATEHGLDPDRWFGHVEAVLPLLSRAEYAGRARFGYCRCRQPVEYVRSISERYRAYSRALGEPLRG